MNHYRVDAILVAIASILALSEPAQSVTLNTVDKLTVFDANSLVVGTAFGNPIAPIAVFQVDGRFVPVFVFKQGFGGTGNLFFESLNCSGPAFMQVPDGISYIRGVIDNAAVGAPGATAYLPNVTAPDQPIVYKSYLSGGTPVPVSCTQFPGGQPIQAVPAVAIIDLNTRFTPPFSLSSSGQAATPLPTLSEWARMLAVGLLLASGVWFLSRRRAEHPN